MEPLTGLFGDATLTVLSVLVQVVIVIAGAFAISVLRQISKKTNIQISESIQKQIVSLIDTVVACSNQKVVSILKATNPDGKLTEEQKTTIFNTVKDSVLEILSSDQVKYLEEKYLTIDKALEYLIEESVSYQHSSALPITELTSTEEDQITIAE